MIEFKSDEQGYRKWLDENPEGYVLNLSISEDSMIIPVLHRSSCANINNPSRTNYTTQMYYKVCSMDLDELRARADAEGKDSVECRHCLEKPSPI